MATEYLALFTACLLDDCDDCHAWVHVDGGSTVACCCNCHVSS